MSINCPARMFMIVECNYARNIISASRGNYIVDRKYMHIVPQRPQIYTPLFKPCTPAKISISISPFPHLVNFEISFAPSVSHRPPNCYIVHVSLTFLPSSISQMSIKHACGAWEFKYPIYSWPKLRPAHR